MSRCATTPSVLDARFAEVDLTRDQAAHVATCVECARAFALLRRFDADLESIGHDLAPERAGDARELMRIAVPEEGSTMSWRRGLIGVAAVAIVLILVTGASFLGDRSFGADVGRVFGLGMDRSEAAAALGLPEDAVVMVGGDAVGLRVRDGGASATLELLVVEASDRRARQVYEDQVDIRPGSGGVYSQPVRCFGLLEEDVHAIMALGWSSDRMVEVGRPGIGGIAGRHVVFETSNHRTALLFVADAESVADDNSYLLDMGFGTSSGTIEDHEVNCAQPATARCGDWSEWSAGTRASMTEWLIETRLDAVRTAQQMPEDATHADVVEAALASIDKGCQGSPATTRLTEIVERLYEPLPINDGRVTARLGEAPGQCAEVTEFAYVGISTLSELGFSDEADEFGDDFERRGRFWVTAEPVAVVDTDALEAEQQAAAARVRAEGQPAPPPPLLGDRPEQRVLCVRWSDGNPTGLVDMAIPDNWSPPSN